MQLRLAKKNKKRLKVRLQEYCKEVVGSKKLRKLSDMTQLPQVNLAREIGVQAENI
jgi:hypothetical protein